MVSKNQNTTVSEVGGSNPSAGAFARQKGASPSLDGTFKGRVIAPDHPDYDSARTLFYGGFDHRPALIACPADAADVAQVIALARQTGLGLAVRSGGHSTAGYSGVDGGIVLDLRDMRGLQIDPENRTAWAEAGLTAGEYTTATGAYGLATGFGDTGSVGLGGITLGGGMGYLSRKYGLTIDSLLAAEMVLADGRQVFVDAGHEPDLFWAIRGGGGNFGVVTRFQFRLHPVDTVLGGMLILPATPAAIAAFIAAAAAAPEELSTIANVMPSPPMPFVPAEFHGRLILMALMVYTGPVEAGQAALAPFRAIATPIADLLRPMHYPEMYPPEEGEYHPTAVTYNFFMDHVGLPEAETIVSRLEASDAPMRVAQLRVLGGAVARVPVEATAFAHRTARINVSLASFYNGPEDRLRRTTWLNEFVSALDQGDLGAYVNFMGNEGEARVRSAYPAATWKRLAAIKARYDPTNLFRLNQNVPPAK